MVKAGMASRDAVSEVTARLAAAGCEDAGYDASLLFTLATGRDRHLFDAYLSAEQAEKLEALCEKRASRVPLQYLAGEWGFLDFMLKVGPGVLCPRADTEIVALAAIQALQETANPAPCVLDMCAGTGALGLGVKRFVPGAQVRCVEKSPEALAYLRQNTAALVSFGIAEPAVQVSEGDLFTFYTQLPDDGLDMLLCNPPYLTATEMGERQPEVSREPAMALDGGEDGLVFYRALAEHYKGKLAPGGTLVLEIGWHQKGDVMRLLRENGWGELSSIRDFGGNDRCVAAKRK